MKPTQTHKCNTLIEIIHKYKTLNRENKNIMVGKKAIQTKYWDKNPKYVIIIIIIIIIIMIIISPKQYVITNLICNFPPPRVTSRVFF